MKGVTGKEIYGIVFFCMFEMVMCAPGMCGESPMCIASWINAPEVCSPTMSRTMFTPVSIEIDDAFIASRLTTYETDVRALFVRINAWDSTPGERIAAVQELQTLYESNAFERSRMLQGRVDFHAHTIYSDGQLTPAFLVAFYWLHGLSALAITDHNTFDGISEAIRVAEILGIIFVPGIEISVFEEVNKYKKLHVTAFWQGGNNKFLRWMKTARMNAVLQTIEYITQKEKERMVLVREMFNQTYPHMKISDDDVRRFFPYGAAKRTDLARILCKKIGGQHSGLEGEYRIKEIKDTYFTDIKVYNGKTVHYVSLAAISKFCIQNNFAVAWAHPLVRDKWRAEEVRDVLSKYFLAFRAIEYAYPSINNVQMRALDTVVEGLNQSTYRSSPLLKIIGLDIHSNVQRRFGLADETDSGAGLIALRASFDTAQLIHRGRRAQYYYDCLIAWARLPLFDQVISRIYPVWSDDDDFLGRTNEKGQVVTVTPLVIRYMQQEGSYVECDEQALICACVRPQLSQRAQQAYAAVFENHTDAMRVPTKKKGNMTRVPQEYVSSETCAFIASCSARNAYRLLVSLGRNTSMQYLKKNLRGYLTKHIADGTLLQHHIRMFKLAQYARIELASRFNFLTQEEAKMEKRKVTAVVVMHEVEFCVPVSFLRSA